MMSRVLNRLRLAAVVAALAGLAVAGAITAQAQNDEEISPSHMAAALDAVQNGPDSKRLDDILPGLSLQVQNQLIQLRPDLHKEITDAVESTALKLVGRRKELNDDLARVWARSFSEQDLKAIAAFYKSDAGKKLAEIGPKVIGDSLQTTRQWSNRVGEELLEKSREELKQRNVDF
jgi:hypothetical protein